MALSETSKYVDVIQGNGQSFQQNLKDQKIKDVNMMGDDVIMIADKFVTLFSHLPLNRYYSQSFNFRNDHQFHI